MTRIRHALLAAVLMAAPAGAQAQLDDEAAPLDLLSLGLAASRTDGMLGDHLGASVRVLRRLDDTGWLRLRVEAGVLLHGRESFSVPNSDSEMRLTNTLAFAGVGPQVQLPRGPVRPYIQAFAGMHYLFTRADNVGQEEGNDPVEITTTYETGTWSWGGGAGVYVPVSRGVLIDAGLTWREGGEVNFSSFESGFGQTETDLRVAHLAVTFEL